MQNVSLSISWSSHFSGIAFHILRLNQDSSSGQPNGHTSPFPIFGVLENYTMNQPIFIDKGVDIQVKQQ